MVTQAEFDTRTREQREDPGYKAEYERMRLAYEIGAAVRIARETLGWTQTYLAERAGMKQHALSRVESGDVLPTLETVHRIATALESRFEMADDGAGIPHAAFVTAA